MEGERKNTHTSCQRQKRVNDLKKKSRARNRADKFFSFGFFLHSILTRDVTLLRHGTVVSCNVFPLLLHARDTTPRGSKRRRFFSIAPLVLVMQTARARNNDGDRHDEDKADNEIRRRAAAEST